MELIEGNDHRLTKAVSRLVDQRRNGHLILPWTYTRHLLEAFGSSLEIDLRAEFIQATKAYYSTAEGFVTSDPLLLNLRCVAGHIMRERGMYNFAGGHILDWGNMSTCVDSLMNGHWEELFGKVEELLHATDDPDNYCMLIRLIIEYTSDGRQRLESFLRPHVTTCQQSPRCRICGEEHEESRHYNPLVPTTDDAEMQVDQDARANQLTNPSCINCKRAGLEAMDHPANWTRCPERLRHIGNLRDKTKSRSKPKSARPLPGNNSGPVPTSSNNIN